MPVWIMVQLLAEVLCHVPQAQPKLMHEETGFVRVLMHNTNEAG